MFKVFFDSGDEVVDCFRKALSEYFTQKAPVLRGGAPVAIRRRAPYQIFDLIAGIINNIFNLCILYDSIQGIVHSDNTSSVSAIAT